MNLCSTIKKYITQYRLIEVGDCVVVGISGGADSVALTYLLKDLRSSLGMNLHLAHYNHHLRKESDLDERFVIKLAEQLNLPLTVGHWKHSGNIKGSIEEKARAKRLAFLTQTAEKFNAKSIALAHHQDDQAETVLMRLLRGSGLKGMRAMLPSRDAGTVKIIRPLLSVSRGDIEQFLKKEKILFKEDLSNRDVKFFRNKIRHELMPLLVKEYNAGIQSVLCRYAENVAGDYKYIETQTQKAFDRIVSGETSQKKLVLDQKPFKRLPETIQNELLRKCLENLKGHAKQVNATHIKEIKDLIDCRPDQSIVDLPFAIRVKKSKERIVFDKKA